MSKICFYGWPRRLGGANMERWHSGKLLSEHHEVIYLKDSDKPVFADDVSLLEECDDFATRVDFLNQRERFQWIIDNPDVLIIGMCSGAYRNELPFLDEHNIKNIWVPCMCYAMEPMPIWLHSGILPTHTVFQSQYQQSQFDQIPDLPQSMIHGLYSGFGDKPPKRQAGKTILKLCRPDPAKFANDYWYQCQEIFDKTGYLTRVVGYSQEVEDKIGPPPGCVSVHEARSMPLAEAFAGCPYLFPGFGACVENWPQVAYEALSHGCLPIFEDIGGPSEMNFASRPVSLASIISVWHRLEHNSESLFRSFYSSAAANVKWALEEWLSLIEKLEAMQ